MAGRDVTDFESVLAANRKQAMVPEGATTLDPVGTAPGLVVPFGDGPEGDRAVVLDPELAVDDVDVDQGRGPRR